MAIGPIHVEWLSLLASKGLLCDGAKYLDLGPQDIQATRTYISEIARRHLTPASADMALARIFDDDEVRSGAQTAFYSIFGCTSYASVDLLDERATYSCDLNAPLPPIGTYDVVTNFGTVEHVFDIAQAFRSIHTLLKPGGIALHCMPAFAFIDHGFYNIHPALYVEFARANAYEIADFRYVDNMFVRNRRHTSGLFDFDALPVTLADTGDTQKFMTKVADLYRSNLESTPPDDVHGYTCFVFDLAFVALRRTDKSPAVSAPAVQGGFDTLRRPLPWWRRILGRF